MTEDEMAASGLSRGSGFSLRSSGSGAHRLQ